MELIKQTEGRESANTQEGQHNDHVSGIQFTTVLTRLIGALFILVVSVRAIVFFGRLFRERQPREECGLRGGLSL